MLSGKKASSSLCGDTSLVNAPRVHGNYGAVARRGKKKRNTRTSEERKALGGPSGADAPDRPRAVHIRKSMDGELSVQELNVRLPR